MISVLKSQILNHLIFLAQLKLLYCLDESWLILSISEFQKKKKKKIQILIHSSLAKFFTVLTHLSHVLLVNSSSDFNIDYVSNSKNYNNIKGNCNEVFFVSKILNFLGIYFLGIFYFNLKRQISINLQYRESF